MTSTPLKLSPHELLIHLTTGICTVTDTLTPRSRVSPSALTPIASSPAPGNLKKSPQPPQSG